MPAHPIHFADLGISPVALDLGGPFVLRWYAISYLVMLGLGWWYLRLLVARPGAPMSRAQVDDALGFTALGVLAGGRLGYCLFYDPSIWRTLWRVLELWNGGMSFHGGLIGLLLVRIANFVNGELWGRPSNLPWAMIFPGSHDGIPRHPSQFYEAFLEGGLVMLLLTYLFWRTDARCHPGRLAGSSIALYGVTRFLLEYTRQPDKGLEHLPWGLSMGQTLCLPMIAGGAWLILRSAPPHAPAPAAA